MAPNIRNNLKKNQIIKNIHDYMGLSLKYSESVSNDIIKAMIFILRTKNKINIKNLGSFKTIHKNKRIGRNPKSGKIHEIKKRVSISFKPSIKLINEINK